MKEGCILGIDTSNYKTSVALIQRDGTVIHDLRRLLRVKQGEKGLRQSAALFQHIENLPSMVEEAFKDAPKIEAVAYSKRPRPVEGSYMPVFKGGESTALSIGSALRVPCFGFSHQEGHIEAVKRFSPVKEKRDFIACHFSGGTCEILKVRELNGDVFKEALMKGAEARVYIADIIGGSRDISFGQLIDRAGVAAGADFPAGEEADRLALEAESSTDLLSPVKSVEGWINLSGIDTHAKRIIERGMEEKDRSPFFRELFDKISEAAAVMVSQAAEKSGIKDVIMAGGVSSSIYMRGKIKSSLENKGISVFFDDRGLSQDNAVGTAFLGGKIIWD